MLEQVAKAAKVAIDRLAVFLVGQRLHRIEPEDLGDPQAQGVEVCPQIGPVVGIDRGVSLDIEDLPSRRVLEQFLAYHVRLVLLRGDGVNHHVTVGKHGAQDVEMALATGPIVGVLRVGVRAVNQDHLLEERDIQAMDFHRIGIEAEEAGIDIWVTGHDRPSGHGPVFLAGPADRPAQQGVEERALACARASQKADHQRPIQIDLGNPQSWLEPGDEALGRGERRPGRGRAGPVDQPRVKPVESGQQVLALPVGGVESISQGVPLSPHLIA